VALQAHLQVAQSRHTLLLSDTLFQVKHPTEGRTYNRGFSAMLADGSNFGFLSPIICISGWPNSDETFV